jgi:hypothetical protein
VSSANTKLRLFCGTLCAAAVCSAQVTIVEESVVAKLDAAITSGGVLQATLIVTAFGARSLPYREAFRQGTAQNVPPTLFGRFTQDRQLRSTPLVTDANTLDRPIKIQFPIHEDDFILPIQRKTSLRLDLLPTCFGVHDSA